MITIGDDITSKIIDNFAVNDLGIPMSILMENASLSFIQNINLEYNNFLIVCGKGNNGGDGFAIARHLTALNKNVSIFLVNDKNMTDECKLNYNICKNMSIPIETDINKLEFLLLNSSIVIDAIFGVGFKGNIDGIYLSVIKYINELSKYTISVDLPSGLGNPNCIIANETISFITYKKAFLEYNNLKFIGKVKVVQIFIPKNITNTFSNTFLLDIDYIKSLYSPRKTTSHKGNFGHSLIIAGSEGFSGAAIITSNSAVRSGSGLTTTITDKSTQKIISTQLLEGMTANFDNIQTLKNLLIKANAIAFGPGLGNSKETLLLLEFIISNSNATIILDADGINVLSKNISLIDSLKNRCIMTPHIAEFSRISGYSIEEINNNRIDITNEFAKKHSIIVLLKGYNSIISNGINNYVNTTGNSHMANGGMGDCLTGIVTSFVSQGYSPINSIIFATYLHGYIGDKLLDKLEIINASHIIENIPVYMKDFSISVSSI